MELPAKNKLSTIPEKGSYSPKPTKKNSSDKVHETHTNTQSLLRGNSLASGNLPDSIKKIIPKMMKMATLNQNAINPFIDPISSFNYDDNNNAGSPRFNFKDNEDEPEPEVAAETTTGHNTSKTKEGAIKSFAPGKIEIRLLPPAPGSAGKSKISLESSDFGLKTMKSLAANPKSQFKAEMSKDGRDSEEAKDPFGSGMKRKIPSNPNMLAEDNIDECLKAIAPQDNS